MRTRLIWICKKLETMDRCVAQSCGKAIDGCATHIRGGDVVVHGGNRLMVTKHEGKVFTLRWVVMML